QQRYGWIFPRKPIEQIDWFARSSAKRQWQEQRDQNTQQAHPQCREGSAFVALLQRSRRADGVGVDAVAQATRRRMLDARPATQEPPHRGTDHARSAEHTSE